MNLTKKVVFLFLVILNINLIICNDANSDGRPGLVGGHTPTTDPDTLKQLEKHAIKAVSQLSHTDGSVCTFTKFEDVTQQVVSGILYRGTVHHKCGNEDKKCQIEIWSQPWISKEPKKTWTCPEYQNHEITKRQAVPGGLHELREPEHAEALSKNEHTNGNALHNNKQCEFERFVGGQQQVVAGMKYYLKIEATCDGKKHLCEHEIWEKAWENYVETLKYECKEVTTSRRRREAPLKHHIHLHLHEGRSFTNKGEEHMQRLFDKFKIKHKRNYLDNDEHNRRYKIFKQNLYKIEQLNRMEHGTAKYGITDFADLTKEEYMQRTGLIVPKDHENKIKNPMADILTDLELPKEYDWRTKKVVSEVKNQGSCGSCWAFSAVGNIEGQHAIKYGKLESYSEQELVDCDMKDNGCGGGYMDDAFKAVESLGGIELETEYPYSAKREKCSFDSNKVHARVKGVVDLPKNETAIAQFLIQNGPIAIALNANAMQFYRGGVSKPWKMLCSAKNLDHGVLLVGYGVAEYPKFNKSLPYWIIKNSWGPKWGEQGYYRLYRGDNRCGVAEMASSAVID